MKLYIDGKEVLARADASLLDIIKEMEGFRSWSKKGQWCHVKRLGKLQLTGGTVNSGKSPRYSAD